MFRYCIDNVYIVCGCLDNISPECEDCEGAVGLVWPRVPDVEAPEVAGPEPDPAAGPRHVAVGDDGRHVVVHEVAVQAVAVDEEGEQHQHQLVQAVRTHQPGPAWEIENN